jgi:hypothetical protein
LELDQALSKRITAQDYQIFQSSWLGIQTASQQSPVVEINVTSWT